MLARSSQWMRRKSWSRPGIRTILAGRKRCLVALSGLILLVAACAEQPESSTTGDSLNVVAPSSADTSMNRAESTTDSIYDLLQEDGRFSTFTSLLDSAGLGMTLSGPGPFTVFAPTNEAMAGAGLPDISGEDSQDQLRDILLHHISNGETLASDLPASSIRSLSGGDLQFSGSGDSLMVEGARIIERDVDAANGVVHATDQILMPEMDA